MNSSSAIPQLGNARQRIGVEEQAKHMRPDHDAADDIAQRRSQPQLRNSVTKTIAAPSMIAPLQANSWLPGGSLHLGHRAFSIAATRRRNGNKIAP